MTFGLVMIRRLVVYGLMVAIAICFALRWSPPLALAVWSGLAGGLCLVSALLLSRQPIGVPTMLGRVGGTFLRWGYTVGRGKLPGIVLASWLIWTALGAAVIGLVSFRAEPHTQLMILAWTIDGLALLFLVGRMATNTPRSRSALLIPILAVLGMIGVSGFLWRTRSESARATALLIGGAPIPLLGAGYGLMLGAMLLGGRRGGWK